MQSLRWPLHARSVPLSLWVGSLFVATLSYYTTDYMRQGQEAPEKRNERYVYDPNAGSVLPYANLSASCMQQDLLAAHARACAHNLHATLHRRVC